MRVAVLLAVLLAPSVCLAESPIPAEQWDPYTRISLARCLAGESGLYSEGDHKAIPFVLAKRWRQFSKRVAKKGGTWRFIDQIRQYCKGLSPKRLSRQWVRHLPATPNDPWPDGIHKKHLPRWIKLLRLVDNWYLGRVRNPCKGAAHWGGMAIIMDRERAKKAIQEGRWTKVQCSEETANDYFMLVSGHARHHKSIPTQGDQGSL